jgi:hypothetical protein
VYPEQRQHDPDPIGRGWEAALSAVLITLVAAALAALVGQGLAAAMVGGGWVWPHGGNGQLVRAFVGLLAGRPGEGLGHADAARLPGTTAVYACVASCEGVLVVMLVALGIAWSRYRRPPDARRGMATRAEAAHVLGMAQLRSILPIVRPDIGYRQ